MSNFCTITTFVLLVTLAMLASARPKFEPRKLRMRRNALETENDVAQVFEKLFGRKELETSPEVTLPTPSAVPSPDPEQTDASETKSKRRVRRQYCHVWMGRCPTKRSRSKQAHRHKHAHKQIR